MRVYREDLGALAYTVQANYSPSCVLAYITARFARVPCEV